MRLCFLIMKEIITQHHPRDIFVLHNDIFLCNIFRYARESKRRANMFLYLFSPIGCRVFKYISGIISRLSRRYSNIVSTRKIPILSIDQSSLQFYLVLVLRRKNYFLLLQAVNVMFYSKKSKLNEIEIM